MIEIGYRDLALLKINVLLHDPPNKSFLLRSLGSEFGRGHEDKARSFLNLVLENTSLTHVGLRKEFERIVVEADRVASAFDRWVLRTYEWPPGSYTYYKYLHNVFNPSIRIELKEPSNDNAYSMVALELNNVLSTVEDHTKDVPENELILYNTLYTLLEPIWYSKGLSPSLADTRTPTHTVFDHVYASATVSNMLLGDALNDDPKIDGFYVLIDFPGIQKLVNAGRKVGDLWASSWLLSNLMWSLNEYFMNIYGYDVVVSPTPRLNPYTLRTLISRLLNLGVQKYKLITDLEEIINGEDSLNSVIKNILDIYGKLYDVDVTDGRRVRMLWLQPLIPATTSLLIPRVKLDEVQPLNTENDVAEVINRRFVESWMNLVEFIENELTSKEDLLHQILGGIVKSMRKMLDTPLQGLNVAIVRIANVYEAIKECINDKRIDICNELGLYKIDLESLHQKLENYKIDIESFSKSLVWYILVTRSATLARVERYGRFYNYILRPFWTYNGKQLYPVNGKLERFSEGWIPCSLCGQEPAYVVLRKDTKILKQITFKEEDLGELFSLAHLQSGRDVQNLVTYIFKPGEALGPYCLLKRALYVGVRGHLEIMSTDDVALSAVSELLGRLGWQRILRERADKKSLNSEDIEYLFTPPYNISKDKIKPFKDIYALAEANKINYEDYVERITEHLVETCNESETKPKELLDNISSIIGIPVNDNIHGLLRSLVDSGDISVNTLCRFLSLRTQYAIVKGDADNIGKIISGEMFGRVEDYKGMVRSIRENGEVTGSKEAFKHLENGYKNAEDILKALGLNGLPLSPAIHQAISLSLMLTAISDYKIVKRNGGVLIYSGGDDVLAFLPTETAINTVISLREEFYGNGFKMVNNIPIVSAIPTGRSFSIRFANLMDVMSTEVSKAMESLEKRAKQARWIISKKGSQGQEIGWEKDTLVVTSSRSGVEALLPLRVNDDLVIKILNLIRETPLLSLTIISGNMPEDYHRLLREFETYTNSDSLYILFEYVLEKNIKPLKSTSSKKEVLTKLYEVFSDLKDLGLRIRDEESTAIREYLKLMSISREII
ncbi:MAG: type III-B CRISPR-associated protein Cas10/Cmr2 [Thermosphaera sp.]